MRIKRGTSHVKRRRNILKKAKGFRWGRKNKLKQAKIAVTKAGVHAQRSRRVKKRVNRGVWQVQINAAVRSHDLSYSRFMSALAKKMIVLDRKVLSQLASEQPEVFKALVQLVK